MQHYFKSTEISHLLPALSQRRYLLILFSLVPLVFGSPARVLVSHCSRTPQRCCVGVLLYFWTYESSSRPLHNCEFFPWVLTAGGQGVPQVVGSSPSPQLGIAASLLLSWGNVYF